MLYIWRQQPIAIGENRVRVDVIGDIQVLVRLGHLGDIPHANPNIIATRIVIIYLEFHVEALEELAQILEFGGIWVVPSSNIGIPIIEYVHVVDSRIESLHTATLHCEVGYYNYENF